MDGVKKIKPTEDTPSEIIAKIRKVFGLNEYPFDGMDDDIIFLAFVPECNNKGDRQETLKNKYGTCDHQTLEFYGDRILYGVIANIIYDFFGLTMTSHFYSVLNSKLTKNRLLTDLMIDKNACVLVRSPRIFKIGVQRGKFHNICADSFEALIGAIFIHLKTKRLDYMVQIKNWLLKNTGLPFVLKHYLDEMGFENKTVYVINNRKDLMARWVGEYEKLKNQLISDRNLFDQETFNVLIAGYTKAQRVSENDFSYTGIIVGPYPIDKIFNVLQWEYKGPIFQDNEYILIGYPNGIPTTIGEGITPGEAIENALSFVYARGFVVPMREINLEYSSS